MSEQWGPWISHCGTCVPAEIVGRYIQMVDQSLEGEEFLREGTVTNECIKIGWRCFIWADRHEESWAWKIIIRYRIRKPDALTKLEGLIADLPEEVDA